MAFCGIFDDEGDHEFAFPDFANESWADELPDELADYLQSDYESWLEDNENENENA